MNNLRKYKKKELDYLEKIEITVMLFSNYRPVAVIVRMGDKIQRLSSVSKNGISLVNNESLRDTLIDLHNYSAMAIMLLDE